MAEGARLESVYRGNSIEGSNPSLSARPPDCPFLSIYYASKKLLGVHSFTKVDTKRLSARSL